MTRSRVFQPYALWGVNRIWQDFEVVGGSNYLPAIRRAWNRTPKSEYNEVRVDLELVPEPDNPYDVRAISVRYQGLVVGYFPKETTLDWWPVVARVASTGLTAAAPGRIWYQNSAGFETGSVRLGLGEPDLSLPLNDPPSQPHNLLPSGNVVQVTKEADHFDVLADYVPPSGAGALYVTLHKEEIVSARSRRVVAEVRLDGERVGELTKATSEKFLPAIEHNTDRGLGTAVRAAIKGSGIAAELTIRAAKAHELDDAALDGPAVRLPSLPPYDPNAQYRVPNAYGQTTTAVRARSIREEKQAFGRGANVGHDAEARMPSTPRVKIQPTLAQPPRSQPASHSAPPLRSPEPNHAPASPRAAPVARPPLPPQPVSETLPLVPYGASSCGKAPLPVAKSRKNSKGIGRALGLAAATFFAAFALGILISGLGSPGGGAVAWLLGVPVAIAVGIWSRQAASVSAEENQDPGDRWKGP
ncbi:HIRAN domain-containing protein [Dietzia sp. UCD-THP]|uniref:HIRAN domain-containing protein n=1 Tax=Dietzia sp. UCD-THP TaxID=1292020 RepID=UPI0003A55600|nr:HIRAN domain-containing protein [Dietzia sp. UCD-THP]